MKKGRYYLGRVIKFGNLDQQKLMSAICDAPTISVGKYEWTITDVVDKRNEENPYIYGELSKFAPEGHVKVIDIKAKSQIDSDTANLVVASSPFIYLPEFSGIAHLHVWNGIQEDVFPRRFSSIIENAYDNFFVDCQIEPISDYKAFTTKLKAIEHFTEISAKVHPPNPLFGRLWGSLDSYIRERNASEISVKESNEGKLGLKTKVVTLMSNILKNSSYQPDKEPDITDAALLMAADGYGSGKVVGVQEGEEVIIKTSDTKKSFLFAKEPEVEKLAKASNKQFEKINKERDMKH